MRSSAYNRIVVAVLSAFGLVPSALSHAVHASTEQHVRCPEHGEQIHARAGGPGDAEDVPTVGARAAAAQSHQHCTVLVVHVADDRASPVLVAYFRPSALRHAPSAPLLATAGLLRAPKTSPPV